MNFHFDFLEAKMTELRRSSMGVLINFLLLTSAFPAGSESIVRGHDFDDKVTGITENGQIQFETFGVFRLWGVLTDPEKLRTLLVGKQLRCTKVGQTSFSGVLPLQVITCNGTSSTDPKIGDIGRLLISGYGAVEICSETFGRYKTCSK